MRGIARAACAALALSALVAEVLAAQPAVRLPGQDRALAGRFATVFEVGREEGRSWEVLSDVRQVAFDAQDNLYVLDRGNARVLVFDRNGRFVRQIGKKGGGPGELTAPGQLAVTASGELVVSDNGRRAFSIFSREGRFLRSVAHDGRYGLSGFGLAAHPRGGVVTVAQPIPLGGGPSAGNTVLWYPLTPSAQTAKLLEIADEPAEADEVESGSQRARVISTRKPAFAPTLRWELLPTGGVVAASKAEYAVQVTNPRGTVTRVLERPIRPRPVTERDRESELARRRESNAAGRGVTVVGGGSMESLPPEVRAMVNQAMNSVTFARVVPVIQDLTVDRAGRIWVQRAGASGQLGPVDLLSPDGRYLGTLPPQQIPGAFSASGRAAYIVKDDMGVEKVVVRTVPNLGS